MHRPATGQAFYWHVASYGYIRLV